MKAIKLSALALTIGLMLGACNSEGNSDTTSDTTVVHTDTGTVVVTHEYNADSSLANFDEDSRKFIEDAARGGNMEVALGQTGMKSGDQKIKDLGKMIEDDHNSLNQKLSDLVSKKGGQVPTGLTKDQQKDVDDLNAKSAEEFDEDYLDKLEDMHKKDIDKFTDASKNLKDEDVRKFAADALPTLKKHLEKVQQLEKKK